MSDTFQATAAVDDAEAATPVPRRSRRRRVRTLLVGVITTLLFVWAYAPMDLIPDWAAVGSAPNVLASERIPQPDGSVLVIERSLVFPEGFVRGLVGYRTADAVAQVRVLGSWYQVHVSSDNFMPATITADFSPTRVSLTVLLGRVVRAELKG